MNYWISANNKVVPYLNYKSEHIKQYVTAGYTLYKTPNYVVIDNVMYFERVYDNIDQYYGPMRDIKKIVVLCGIIPLICSLFNKSQRQSRHETYAKCTIMTKDIIVITPCITHAYFENFPDRKIFLNSSLVYLNLSGSFNQPIVISKNIGFIVFGLYFNQSFKLNKRLKVLKLICDSFTKISGKNLKYLSLAGTHNATLNLPKNLIYLALGAYCESRASLVLTPNIKYLCMAYGCTINVVIDTTQGLNILTGGAHIFNPVFDSLPDNIEKILITHELTCSLDNLPNHLNMTKYLWGRAYLNNAKKYDTSVNFRFID